METQPTRGQRRTRAESTRRSVAVRRLLIGVAMDVVAEVGSSGVTVRALAARTHYSPSSIGYHTTPMPSFVDALWQEVARRFASEAITLSGESPEWRTQVANGILDWATTHPYLARFLVEHSPLDARPLIAALAPIGSTLAGGTSLSDLTAQLQRFMVRRLQAAIELALTLDRRSDAVALIAGSLTDDLRWPLSIAPRCASAGLTPTIHR